MTRLTFEYDPEPYGKERDGAIIKMAQEFGVETIVRNSHTLYNLDRSEKMFLPSVGIKKKFCFFSRANELCVSSVQ